tara:strand:- start:206 stop:1657 length:1452 start_codon:yes stop_codon:yes gene_type:complete
MAKNSIRDFDNTSGNNTDIQSVDISEGCSPAGINNALREMMADLADVNDGTVSLTSPSADSMTVTGDLTVDTSTLKVDSTNNRVGVGITSPEALTHIAGATADADGALGSMSPQLIIEGGNTNNPFELGMDNSGATAVAFLQSRNKASGAQFLALNPAGGNVGIGTSSPASELHVKGSAYTPITIDGTSGGTIDFYRNGSRHAQIFTNNAGGDIIFRNNTTTERMRIDSAGNVAIGATSTSNKLEVRGVGLFSSDGNYRATNSGVLNVSPNGNLAIGFGGDSDANYYAAIFHNASNTAVGSIFVDASSTTYATSSDYRLKENVAVLTGAIERVKALAPKRFNFIAEPDRTMDGFLAHEAAAVVPEAVQGEKDAMSDQQFMVTPALGDIITPATDDADEVVHSTEVAKPDTLEDGQEWRQTASPIMETRSAPDYQGIDQSKLVPLLTAALQEAITKIETLETKNATQATQIADLITRVTALEAN